MVPAIPVHICKQHDFKTILFFNIQMTSLTKATMVEYKQDTVNPVGVENAHWKSTFCDIL